MSEPQAEYSITVKFTKTQAWAFRRFLASSTYSTFQSCAIKPGDADINFEFVKKFKWELDKLGFYPKEEQP